MIDSCVRTSAERGEKEIEEKTHHLMVFLHLMQGEMMKTMNWDPKIWREDRLNARELPAWEEGLSCILRRLACLDKTS